MGIKEELAFIEQVRKDATFGQFVQPSEIDCESDTNNLAKKYRIAGSLTKTNYSHHRELFSRNRNHKFADYLDKISRCQHPNVEQCSPKYYYDLINYLTQQSQIKHICDVGVYLGGSAAYLAQAVVDLDITLDLIDVNLMYLGFTYERIVSIVPEAASRIRIFHGDFPAYVAAGHLSTRQYQSVFAQFDASHRFPDVVKDMVCIAKEKAYFHGFSIQDTHLRSDLIEAEVFVDLAVNAVFGTKMDYVEIGSITGKESFYIPGHEWKIYLRPNAPEGILLEMKRNTAEYFGN